MMAVKRLFQVVAFLAGITATVVAEAQQTFLEQVFHNNWLQCRVIDGRIRVEATRLGNIQFTNSRGRGPSETISLRCENNRVTLAYRRATDVEQLSVDLDGAGDRLTIRRTPQKKATEPNVEFRQAAEDGVSLTIGSDAKSRVYRAKDIWRLMVAQPGECRQYAIPLLELLQPKFSFGEMAADVEAKLFESSGGTAANGREHWAALVRQLGDDRFAVRQAADRQLRSGDVVALAYLKQLDFHRLDAEQQFRVGRIIDSQLGQQKDDTPGRVAASMAVDAAVWCMLLARPQQSIRETAVRRLEALLGEPIPVDPVAKPESQQLQREQLQRRIEAQVETARAPNRRR
jgi:hypothetical protein